ncbi:MAG: hypothetical protein ACYCX2_02195 [Christensenellales bacterium]
MSDIDSNAYKALKKLSKLDNSRGFPPSQSYWLSYLYKRNLVEHAFIQTSEHESLGVYIITIQGVSYIKDQKRKTCLLWFRWSLATFVALLSLAVMIVTLLLTIRQQPQ